VLDISFQQTLAFQIPGQAIDNGMAELIEFAVGEISYLPVRVSLPLYAL
jgi:hypothetical protein